MRGNKRVGRKRQRQKNIRIPTFERMLIITEGTKTEITYFTTIKDHIQARFKDNLIVDKIDIDLKGTGRGTMEVVKYALKSKNRHTYSDVWVVFDKDDFTDFDEAIKKAEEEGLSVAWSNCSFELWYLLHFQNVTSPMDNKVLTERLTIQLQQQGIISDVYSKNQPILYEELKQYTKRASERSEALLKRHYEEGIILASKMNPATTVQNLVVKLLPYLV